LDQAPIFTNLKTFPYEQFRGKVDILSGGFPCQPFSSAGKRKATDDPRHLFPFIADGIQKCEPRIVFLENVQGILSCKTGDGEPVLQYVLRELEQMGYRATAGIFSAEEVGAPHQRKRVFILGYSKSRQSRLKTEWQRGQGSSGTSTTELGYASSNGYEDRCTDAVREERKSQEGRVQEPQRGSNATPELAHTCSKGSQGSELSQALHREAKAQYSTSQCSNDERSGQNPELANSESEGLEGHAGLRSKQDRGCELTSQGLWPSRPSQSQYEWEEPRVTAVANTKSRGTGRKPGDFTSKGQNLESTSNSSPKPIECKAESQLGGATDGTTCRVDATTNRVDRLRLLGNGVVNQTAAKAFVTLIQRLT
jgi:DNA (cytosine-5)-methyltransferase 1